MSAWISCSGYVYHKMLDQLGDGDNNGNNRAEKDWTQSAWDAWQTGWNRPYTETWYQRPACTWLATPGTVINLRAKTDQKQFGKYAVEHVRSDDFKHKFLKSYDSWHPRACHRAIVMLWNIFCGSSCINVKERDSNMKVESMQKSTPKEQENVEKEVDKLTYSRRKKNRKKKRAHSSPKMTRPRATIEKLHRERTEKQPPEVR